MTNFSVVFVGMCRAKNSQKILREKKRKTFIDFILTELFNINYIMNQIWFSHEDG